MYYFIFLKKQNAYFNLTQISFEGVVHPGMVLSFDSFEIRSFEQTCPELKGMSISHKIDKVYRYDDVSFIFLTNEV